MTTFNTAIDNAQTTLGAAHTSGSGTLTVATGKGALFGTPSSGSPILVTVVKAASLNGFGQITDPTGVTVFPCTGVTGDVLTLGTATSGTTDQTFAIGDTIGVFTDKRFINDLNAAVNAIEANYLTSASALAGAKVSGDISGNAASINGSITESQVTNLTTDLAAKAPLASPTFTGTPAAPTPTTADNSTKLATTAFVKAQGYGTGSGSVTSVALTLPSIFTVAGSPVTTAGTLAGSLATQAANALFAGPTTGAAAAPTFRALVAADVPPLDASILATGTVATARLPALVASGASHAAGIVPDPGVTAGSTRFLREDATWAVPAGGGGGSPGGSTGAVQWNNSGVLAGAADVAIGAAGQLNLTAIANGSPADGDLWYGSTQKALSAQINGLKQHLIGCLYTQITPTASPVAGTTLTSLANDTGAIGTRTLQANFLATGKVIRIIAGGYMTGANLNVDQQFKVLLGGVTIGQTPSTLGGCPGNTTSNNWRIDLILTHTGSGVIWATGFMTKLGSGSLQYAFTLEQGLTPGSPPTVTTTGTLAVDIQAAWVTSNAGQAIAMTQLVIEALN